MSSLRELYKKLILYKADSVHKKRTDLEKILSLQAQARSLPIALRQRIGAQRHAFSQFMYETVLIKAGETIMIAMSLAVYLCISMLVLVPFVLRYAFVVRHEKRSNRPGFMNLSSLAGLARGESVFFPKFMRNL